MQIASATAACADLNARLPLPINRVQTRLYQAIFNKLGANRTVALRAKSGFIDSESGEAISYDERSDPERYIGMNFMKSENIEWNSYSSTKKVYTVCEKISCQKGKIGFGFSFCVISV